MSNQPPEGEGAWGEPLPGQGWGEQPGGWAAGQGPGEAGGWGAGTAYGEGPSAPYGQPPLGPPPSGLPSYRQFGGPQGNWAPAGGWGGQLATWGQRAGGYIIDAVIWGLPTAVLYVVGAADNSPALVVLGLLWWLATWAWFAVQSGRYGSSPGMRVMGLKLVRAANGQTIGGALGFVRQLLHVLGGALCGLVYVLDMLWPLWDSQRQTLADKVMGTVVVRVPPERFSLVPRSR